jgi:hypothetical protein
MCYTYTALQQTTVRVDAKCDMKHDEAGWLLRERPCGKLVRSIVFPDTADLANGDVKMEVTHYTTNTIYILLQKKFMLSYTVHVTCSLITLLRSTWVLLQHTHSI